MYDIGDVGVFLGLDVGKSAHHGHGLTTAGKKVFDKPLPNSEPKLRAVFDKLATKFGTVLVIVDQPASIGAPPLTVARDAGCKVAYLPGLAMRRIADLYPGEAKSDAKDAAVIADAARTMPHTLRSLELTDEITAELSRRGPRRGCSAPAHGLLHGVVEGADPLRSGVQEADDRGLVPPDEEISVRCGCLLVEGGRPGVLPAAPGSSAPGSVGPRPGGIESDSRGSGHVQGVDTSIHRNAYMLIGGP